MQVDSLKKRNWKGKDKHQPQRGTRTNNTSNTTSTRARTVANVDIGRKIAGILVEERMTIPLTEIMVKARVNTQEVKHVAVVETDRVVSFARFERCCRTLVHFKRGPVDHGCDNQFRVFHKETSWCRVFDP